MKLSNEQYQKFISHLQNKWKQPICQVCQNNEWNVAQEVYEIREFHGGSMVLGGGLIVPIVPVTCKVCGNTVNLNPMVAGIIPKEGVNVK